ncbi:MAG: hypothetical protein HFG80_08105 [Eubacterium sp.]|jgi:hypothetical protein|nr:hypothetical protein [Eubacterium sp.]
MKKRTKKAGKKCKALILAAVMLFAISGIPVQAETAGQAASPANPVHHCTKQDGGADTTDWSYIYFGSYPQTEVTGDELTSAITGAPYDSNGDAWVGGVKYRRLRKGDDNYKCFGSSRYRYFKWEKIKWKVLQNNGDTLFIAADKGLACKDYNEKYVPVTWENCTLREWLNNDFYGEAFRSEEQDAIVRQTLANKSNPEFGVTGGNNTTDDIFLLSMEEVTNPEYGFCEDYSTCSASRQMQASDYTGAMGTFITSTGDYTGNSWWWLRSPGHFKNFAAFASYDGSIDRTGIYNYDNNMCVPALHIDLFSASWSLADD